MVFIKKEESTNSNSFNKTVIAKALLAGIISLSACGNSYGIGGDFNIINSTETETVDTVDTVDITDVIFTKTSGDCADYDNSYAADVTDVQEDTDFELDLIISSTDSNCTLESNNIPNHDFNATGNFASITVETSQEFIITRNPEAADATEALSQQQYDAVMLNGVPLDILSAGCYTDGENVDFGCTTDDDWLLDPLGTEGSFGADSHNAHTQPTGVYHYHGSPNAMFDEDDDTAVSPVIGFAADGFPIYGSYFDDSGTIRKATSSYELKEGSRGTESDDNPGGDYDGEYIDDYEYTASGDLDECNGMTVDGQYGYYVTETYPWVIACYTGASDSSFSKF